MTATATTATTTTAVTTATTMRYERSADASGCSAHSCRACGASGAALRYCARCRSAAYCSRECQVRDWPTHRTSCRCTASAATSTEELASRFKAATTLARQREGRVQAHGSGFQRHERIDFAEHRKETAARDQKLRAPALWFQKVGYFDTKRKNFERGAQCHGQGCRHQNAAVHSQAAGGGRNAKWSSTATATKKRKNYKSIK